MSTPIHTRADVGMAPPRRVSRSIRPAHLTGHWAGPSPWGGRFDHRRCATIWRGFQSFHLHGRGWYDIAYSSGVCPHGHRYEGRGPGVRTAANGTNVGNYASYATCYIAGAGDPLTDAAKRAFLDEAMRFGVPLDRAHRDWKSTACPGDHLAGWIYAGVPAPAGVPPQPPTANAIAKWAAARRARAAELLPATHDLPDLRSGAVGLAVVHLQRVLNLVSGAMIAEDGRYGPSTVEAVRNIQRFFALGVDGVAGRRTVFTLIASLTQISQGKA